MPKFTILITGEGNVRNGLAQDADAMASQFGVDLTAVGHTGVQVVVEVEPAAPVVQPDATVPE